MTPMQQQYNKIKEEYSDAVVLFRLGDFYETFYEDAVVVSKILGITLTGRGKGESRHPMAGIPYHALPNYLPKLVKAGVKVAIAEQITEPKPGQIVERQVTKVITPGTVMEENTLDESKSNYIAAVFKAKNGKFYASVCDISTGYFDVSEYDTEFDLVAELQKQEVAEVILSQNQAGILGGQKVGHTELRPEEEFHIETCLENLLQQFEVNTLKGFGIEDDSEKVIPAGALLSYVQTCLKQPVNHINKIINNNKSRFLKLDANTIRNLELLYPLNSFGDKRSTLINVLDNCVTSIGKRTLREWLLYPLTDVDKINSRLNIVEEFVNHLIDLDDVREQLAQVPDLQRLASKVGVNAANPKEVKILADGIVKTVETISEIEKKDGFKNLKAMFKESGFNSNSKNINKVAQLAELINRTLADDPPISIPDGGVIKEGFHQEVDNLRNVRGNSKTLITQMQSEYVKSTNISSLKISYNKVFGYYIEVTRMNANKVPANFVRKQTLANAERFITPELKNLEDEIFQSEDKLLAIESKLYAELIGKINTQLNLVIELGFLIGRLDTLSTYAHNAHSYGYTKPTVQQSGGIKIKEGKHPVVSQLTSEFVSNSTEFTVDDKIKIITGPNMSGKSTYIRQVALITLMAHIGSYVPAEMCIMCIIDKIFTRVGAADNLAKGESTFMVEMIETANILNNATENSLVILDEVGRGTSTYDGVAIAWSILEYIASTIQCNTLFATHYHELIALEQNFKSIKNYHVDVKESGEDIEFKYKILPGGTSKSYGIYAAKIAGVPKEVLARATKILDEFESSDNGDVENSLTNSKSKSSHNKPRDQKENSKNSGKGHSNFVTKNNTTKSKSSSKGKNPSKPRNIHPEQMELI